MMFSLRRMLRERALWLLIASVVVFFGRPLFFGETFFFRDIYLLFFGKKVLWAEALRSGQIPLWDPLMHGGQPFLASPANAFFYPFNLLFLIFAPLTAFNIHLVVQFLCCALSAYFLGRVLGLSEAASFVCGATYALCGYVLSSATLLVLMQAVPWPPAMLASVILLMRERRKRWLVASAIFGALPILGGGADMSAMTFALVALWAVIVAREVPIARRVTLTALVFLFVGGLTLMQTVPAYEVIRNSSRSEKREYTTFVQWSVSPQRLPELVVPQFFGPTDRLARSDYWGGRYEYGYPYIVSIYCGVAALLLAIAGLFSPSIPMRGRALFAAFAVGGFVLCLGGYLPFFHFLWERVPLIGIFRFPVKALQLTLVPLAALGGAGVDVAIAARRKLLVPAAVAVAALLVAALFHESIARVFFGSANLLPRFAHSIVVVLLLIAALFTNRKAAIAVVVLLDLAIAGWRVNPYASRELFVEPPLATKVKLLLRDGGRLYRTPDPFVQRLNVPSNENVWLAWWDLQLLSRYTAATFGIPLVFHEDYDGLAPIQMARMTDRIAKMSWPERLPVLSEAGATVIITPDVVNLERIETMRGANGLPLYVYRNRASTPLRLAGGGQARTIKRSFNEWSVDVNATMDGALVFAETFYPGWRMTVDGREFPQKSAGFGLSAVDVPAGHHVVTKTYRPRLPLIGLAGSFLAALALAFLRINQ